MKRRNIYWIITILVFFILIFLLTRQKPEENSLSLYMLNIGQGDATLIETPGGRKMLIDSGRDRSVLSELGKYINTGETIDIIEVSNPDLDHIGGFPFVMEKYKIGQILSPGTNHTISAYTEIEKLAQEQKINIYKPKSGDVVVLDKNHGVTYTVLWPEGNVADWERNSGSMVGLIEYEGKKILLTGDAPKEVEDEVLKKYGKYLNNIDILKVGHHGSNTSTGERLIMLTTPKYALISAGENNRYGHPHIEVLNVLNKYNIKTITTIQNGTIECIIHKAKETICK